jgi:TPR repeat protein
MYDQGNGVKKNLAEAIGWYRKACDAGHEEACRALALMDASSASR